MGFPMESVLGKGQKVGFKVHSPFIYPNLPPDVVSMELYRPWRQMHQFRYLLCGMTVFDKIGNTKFCGREIKVPGGQLLAERRDDIC